MATKHTQAVNEAGSNAHALLRTQQPDLRPQLDTGEGHQGPAGGQLCSVLSPARAPHPCKGPCSHDGPQPAPQPLCSSSSGTSLPEASASTPTPSAAVAGGATAGWAARPARGSSAAAVSLEAPPTPPPTSAAAGAGGLSGSTMSSGSSAPETSLSAPMPSAAQPLTWAPVLRAGRGGGECAWAAG